MIFSGRALRSNAEFNYPRMSVDNARLGIKEFPLLEKAVNGFKNVDDSNYNQNQLITLAKDAHHSPFLRAPDIFAKAKLAKYEYLLKHFLEPLKGEAKKKILARLAEFGENHHKLMLELDFLLELLEKNTLKSISYEDPKKGTHDFNLDVDGTELNMEFTSLGMGYIQKLVDSAFDKAAAEIVKHVPEKLQLKLYVDTLPLLKEENNEVEKIKNAVVNNFLQIMPIIFVKKNDVCLIQKNIGPPEKSLYDIQQNYHYLKDFGERLTKLLETAEGIAYLRGTKNEVFADNPITAFSFGDARAGTIEIDSEMNSWSGAESKRKLSVLGQLERRITCKIVEEQLKGKKNPLLVINFQDFGYHDYADKTDIFGQKNYEEIKIKMHEVFAKTEEKEILGILFIDGTISKSIFMPNPAIPTPADVLTAIHKLTGSSSVIE